MYSDLTTVNDILYLTHLDENRDDIMKKYENVRVIGPINIELRVSRHSSLNEVLFINKTDVTLNHVLKFIHRFYSSPITKEELCTYLQPDGDIFNYISDALKRIDNGETVTRSDIMGDLVIEGFYKKNDKYYIAEYAS